MLAQRAASEGPRWTRAIGGTPLPSPGFGKGGKEVFHGGWVVSGVIAAPVGERGSKLSMCWVSKYTLFPSECVTYRARLQRYAVGDLIVRVRKDRCPDTPRNSSQF